MTAERRNIKHDDIKDVSSSAIEEALNQAVVAEAIAAARSPRRPEKLHLDKTDASLLAKESHSVSSDTQILEMLNPENFANILKSFYKSVEQYSGEQDPIRIVYFFNFPSVNVTPKYMQQVIASIRVKRPEKGVRIAIVFPPSLDRTVFVTVTELANSVTAKLPTDGDSTRFFHSGNVEDPELIAWMNHSAT